MLTVKAHRYTPLTYMYFLQGSKRARLCLLTEAKGAESISRAGLSFCAITSRRQVHLSLSLPLNLSLSLTLSTSHVAFYNKLASLLVVFDVNFVELRRTECLQRPGPTGLAYSKGAALTVVSFALKLTYTNSHILQNLYVYC